MRIHINYGKRLFVMLFEKGTHFHTGILCGV